MNLESETEKSVKKNRTRSSKARLARSIVVLVAIAALLGGITYAWFFNQMDISTLLKIQPPSKISILGPNGSQMNSFDLSYSASDKTEDQVTIKRVFCVESTDNFELELVHTTNLKGLTFKLYPAKQLSTTENTDSTGEMTVVEDGDENGKYKYSYDSNSAVSGSYINLAPSNDSNYKYANDSQHTTNYGEYSNVQAHAEPVYWLAKDVQKPDTENKVTKKDQNGDDQTYYRTYYVCEVSWTETTKETDIFYIFAENSYTSEGKE